MQQSEVAPAPSRFGEVAAEQMNDPLAATLTTSRALLGVVARSMSDALDVVTLPQFRVMVILSGSGPMPMGTLARRVRAVPSTFSRSLDRMEQQGWVSRQPSPDSRREVYIHLTPDGSRLVAQVTERRGREIAKILARLTAEEIEAVGHAFALFAAAAGEVPADDLLMLGL